MDHPDGLRDPEQYFERLRAVSPQAWIVAEKILEPDESLRAGWPIDGTTGYDFLNVCNGLLVYGEGLNELTEIYSNFTGEPVQFDSMAHAKKLNVEHEALGSDVNRLAQLFVEICENNRDRRDYTRAEIRRAIREVAASFSVYRTYVAPGRDEITEEDITQICECGAIAKTQRSDLSPDLFDFIGDVLTLRARGNVETEFLLRFQQFTSAVMAKGAGGHRILLLQPDDRTERSGRRTGAQRNHPRRIPRALRADAGRPSADNEYSFNARYQTIGRCARTAGGADRNSRTLARGAAPLVAQEPAIQNRKISRSQHGILSLSDVDRRVADCRSIA